MGAVVLLFAVFLLDSCETKGSSTVIPVFVRTGTDLLLDVKEPVTPDKKSEFTWKHNVTINIVRVSGNNEPIIYEERAEFLGNYSLLLKNVQQNDSGMYKAQISAAKDRTVAEYKVTVQDPVSAVNLTVNCSSAPNFTVTCSTVNSHISSTFRCDNKTCSQERSTTTDPSSIDVYLDKRFIICNHSNHVSWEHKKEIKSEVCGPPPVPDGASSLIWTAVPTAVVAPIAIVICVFLFIIYKKKNNSGNTVYEVPQDIDRTRPLNQNPTEDAAGPSPNSTYCMVQPHTGPAESTSHKNQNPETVYAQVNIAAKKKNRSPQNQSTELKNVDTIYVQS